MLLKGQGLTIERPQRTLGILVGVVPALVALILAAVLTLKINDWPVSWPLFLGYVAAVGLFVLALVFAFWAYACASLHYVLDGNGLAVRWGLIRHRVPLGQISDLTIGRGEQRPHLRGLSWWGHHVGPGSVEGLGEVLFFSTHRVPEELVYVRTAETTYGLSPQDPGRFAATLKRLRKNAPAEEETQEVERNWLASHPIWSDRIAQSLALVALLMNIGLFGYLFAVYPGLNSQIAIEFPPLGQITTLDSKRELLKLPATALALLAVNLLAAVGLQRRERAGTYLLLTGNIFLQLLLWVGTAIAISNA
ncbi:MAG: hypothetical protein HYS09_09075 [Chloroflexi bacterium]|nr:hypothetical protein [Chloroflexota bacterium]